jgi:hypothetical protein
VAQSPSGGVGPELYLFSTRWAIAFWGVFDYSNVQQESLLGATRAEILEVLKRASALAIHLCSLDAPILLEEAKKA